MTEAPQVLTRMYELPHLFGVWVLDPEYQAALERSEGEPVYPAANIYLPYHVVQLNLDPEEDDQDGLATTARYLAYRLSGADMFIAPLLRAKDGTVSVGEQETFVAWAITDDLRLNLRIDDDDQWWRFVPSTFDGLRQSGFHGEVLDSILETAHQSGFEVHEGFDLAEAEQMIAEAAQE